MNRTLVVIGAVVVLIGLSWPILGKLPLGRLPGDIIHRSGNTTFYFPIVTMLLLSVVLSLLLWLFRK